MNEITSFSTFGSCASRNIFYSVINKDYKNYFKINKSVESSTLISLMSKPIEYDENLINSNETYDNLCVTDDLTNNFLEFIEKDVVDYIIIDNFFDVTNGVIIFADNQFITSTLRLKNTDFYDFVRNNKYINIFNNFQEYYSLWRESCNKFFNFVENSCNKTKIILNCSRLVYNYIDNEGNISKNVEFEKLAHKINPFLNLFDKYILENFDVDVLKFNSNTLSNKNHVFGLHPIHFEEKYYLEKNQQLLEIIDNNKHDFDSYKFRLKQKKDLINLFAMTKFDIYNLDPNKQKRSSIKDEIELKLNNYNTSRIDIINYNLSNENQKQNNVKIENCSDFNLEYYYPDWFKNPQGKGLIINSQKNFLKFDIIIEGDGELQIYLRSNDHRLNNQRVPIYINYTKLLINNENILTENAIANHDIPFIYKSSVKDKQKITVYVEWMPY